MKSPQAIGLVGAGTMGSGIARVCVLTGLRSSSSTSTKNAPRGISLMASGVEQLHKKAKLSAADRNAALGQLHGTADYGARRSCDFVIEAAGEHATMKLEILRKVDALGPTDAIFATNISKYRPAPFLMEMVAAGKLGRKPGWGFYTYG